MCSAALDAGDLAGAAVFIRQALATVAEARWGHAGLYFRALELRLRQLEDGYECSDAELDHLMKMHLSNRGLGHHDEVVETLWHALARKGRVTEADSLLD